MDKQNTQGDQIAGSPLFKKFLGKAEEYIQKPTRLKQLLNDAYQKASQKKDLGTIAHEAWDTIQTLFRLIKAASSGEYQGLPTNKVVAAVAVVIYFLSPIDLIPDFIPVLGLLDDVALVAWFSTTIKEEMDKFAEWEKTRPVVLPDTDHADKAAAEATAANLTTKPKATNAPVEAPSAQRPVPKPASNTDAGIGSPDSSNPKPSRTTAPDPAPNADAKPHADVAANTTDSSRESNKAGSNHPAGGDSGGNVR